MVWIVQTMNFCTGNKNFTLGKTEAWGPGLWIRAPDSRAGYAMESVA